MIKDFLIKKSIFFRLLISFAIIISFLIIIQSFILFMVYSDSSKKVINDSNSQVLSQVSYSSTYMDSLAKKLCQSAFLDNFITAFIYENKMDMQIMYDALYNLNTITLPNSYVQSIYLYNGTLDKYVSNLTGVASTSDDFYDKEAVDIIKNLPTKKYEKLHPYPRKITKNTYNENTTKSDYTNVFTYIMYDVQESTNKVTGAVILNIKADWLYDTISSLKATSNNSISNMLVTNEKGIVVNHSSSSLFLSDVLKEKYLNGVFTSGKDSGTYITEIDKKKYVLTYVSSELLKWKFISFTPYGTVMSTVNRVQIITIVFCILVIMAGLAFTIINSKNIYSPLSNLIANIKQKTKRIEFDEKSTDEVGFLNSIFTNIFNKAKELEDLSRANTLSMKNDFLKSILLSGTSALEKDDIPYRIKQTVSLDFKQKMFLFILKIDEYKRFTGQYNEEDRALYRFAISNVTNEIVAVHFKNETVDMGSDHLVVILSINEYGLTNNDVNNILIPMIQKIQQYIKCYYSISLSATLGYQVDNINQLGLMYSNTLNLSMYRLIYGHAYIISSSILDEINTDSFKFPAIKEKQLLDSLKLGDLEKRYRHIMTLLRLYPTIHMIIS